MIALGARLTTLALFGTGELLKFAVKLLNRPALGVLILNGVRRDWVWTIADNRVNVAVCGNYLEQSNQEGQLFEFDGHIVRQTVWCPVNILDMDVALLLGERDQSVVLDGREENHLQEGNQLEVVNAGVPAVKQHRLRLNATAELGRHQHLAKQVVL